MRRNTAFLLVAALTIAGFALRLHNLGESSYRGDEAFTVIHYVRAPLLQTLASEIPTKDPQPPLAYALFHFWGRAFGESEFAMRLLPTLASTLGISVLYALGCRIGGRRLGLVAALLWTFHPMHIWHSQDARSYGLWALLSLLALWLALRTLDKRRRIDWVLYIIAATSAAYVYYLELFNLAALNLYVLIDLLILRRPREWRLLRQWIAAQVTIGLLLAVWFLQPRLLTGSGYGGTRGGGVDPTQLLTRFLPSLNFGTTLSSEVMALLWPILLVVFIAGLWLLRRNRYVVLLALLATLPLLVLALISLRLDIYVPRYVLGTTPAFMLIFATVVVSMGQSLKLIGRIVSVALLAGWLVVDVYSLNNYFNAPDYANANWRTMAVYLREHVHENDVVIQAAADESITFYYADIDRLPANPTQPAAEIRAILEDRRANHHSLWLVGRTFPDWPSKDVVPAWFAENMQLVRETTVGRLPVWQYRSWEVKADEVEAVPLATFEGVADLAGVSIQTPDPDDKLTIWAYWRALKPTEQPLKVFVHLTGEINPATGSPLWAQDDQFPQDGRIGTDSWEAGEVYRDVYTLDVQKLPQGDYTLLIGLYNPQTGARIPVGAGDSFAAGSIILP